MIFIALLAIIVPLTLIVGFRLPARIGMTISAAAVGLSAWIIWGMLPAAIIASVIQALHRSLTIAVILFGAVTLLKTLDTTGAMNRIKQGFYTISPDMRIQAVLIAFAFISLLEGASGFGTPVIVAAPLLIALGFSPLASATLALFGDTVACTFGAVATPLIVGLENVPDYSDTLVRLVGAQVTLFDLAIATLLPIGIVSILVIGFGQQSRRAKLQAITHIAPWALLIGLTYAISAFITVRIIGPEFVAIIAGAITLGLGIITAKRGVATPRTIWRHHIYETETNVQNQDSTPHSMTLLRAWLPYIVVIGLLLATRIFAPLKHFVMSSCDASLRAIFGFSDISSAWQPLYSPGIILLIAAIIASYVGRKSYKPFASATKQGSITVLNALCALIPTLIMVQIFSNSGHNTSSIASMPVFIAEFFSSAVGQAWPIFAPILGMIGAFIAGSTTVSTLTMGPVQAAVAADASLPIVIVLALQMIGAAAGNVIAIHNVIAASTVVNLVHRESRIMRQLIKPLLAYGGVIIVIGAITAIILHYT